jgi:hypothetical protein
MGKIRIMNILILSITLLGAACASSRGNVYPLESGYLNDKDAFTRLKAILEANPGLVRLNILGFSGTESLPIYCLDIGRSKAAKNVLLVGQHHGDEVLGVEIVLAWAQLLADGKRKDKDIDAILDSYHFWIVPTINPEGFRVVSQGLYKNKRKNNRDTNLNGKLDLHEDGVDLNRNYPVFWDEDTNNAPTHQNYKGSAPASEPEVQALLLLAQKQRFDLAIFYHSSASGALNEKVFLPALDEQDKAQAERYGDLAEFAGEMATHLKKDYRKGNYEVSPYPGSRVGNARNYFFHIQGTAALLIEVGGLNSDGISVVHPDDRMRGKVVNKHVKALRKVLYGTLSDRASLK